MSGDLGAGQKLGWGEDGGRSEKYDLTRYFRWCLIIL